MFTGPNIITDGLVLALDAANTKSYPGSGTTWRDLSGNDNSGSLINGPTFNNANGGSIVFDGVNDFVTGSGVQLSGSAFSLGCWVRPVVSPVNKVYLAIGTIQVKSQALHLRFVSDTIFKFGLYADDLDVTLNSVTGKWNYILVTLNNNILQSVYQNGSFVGSRTATSFYIGDNQYAVGAWAFFSTQYINAEISSIQVYNRALSPQEVLQNYNAQKSRFGL
jgi:hypothetical protein